jgi:SUMO ligase MMS21 Smc5/6 complex component
MSVRRGVTDCALQLHRLCQVCPLIVLKIVDQNSPIKSVNEKLIVDLLNVQIPTLLYF